MQFSVEAEGAVEQEHKQGHPRGDEVYPGEKSPMFCMVEEDTVRVEF